MSPSPDVRDAAADLARAAAALAREAERLAALLGEASPPTPDAPPAGADVVKDAILALEKAGEAVAQIRRRVDRSR